MSAGNRVFVDTNVLLYSADPADPGKQASANFWLSSLWEQGSGAVSWQVLHEFYANAIRKLGMDARRARKFVDMFAAWQPIDSSLGLIHQAWHWMDTARISYWDALIVSAAERSGSGVLLSEDFQTGRKFGAMTVVNPFETPPTVT